MVDKQPLLRNPYTAGRPVAGKNFFGRDKIFQSLYEALVTSQQRVLVLHGQRRIGKSSILQELPDKLPQDLFIFVNFDLQFYAGQDLNTVLYALTQAICLAMNLEPPSRKEFDKTPQFFEKTFLPSIQRYLSGQKYLLILIDEFDIIRESDNWLVPVASREFTQTLQNITNSEFPLSLVLVAGSNLEKLWGYMQSIFRVGIAVRVAFFDPEETRNLITQPEGNALTYDRQAIDAIYNLTSGHPYFTQLLCWEIFNRAASIEKMNVSADDVDTAQKKALVSGMGAFSWIWNELSVGERVYLAAVALTAQQRGQEMVEDKDIQETLESYGIQLVGADLPQAAKDLVDRQFLEREGPHKYCFTVRLIQSWITKEHPLDSIRQEVENINPEAREKFEEGREAYEHGKLEIAVEAFQTAIKMNPNHIRAKLRLAQTLFEKKDYEQAVNAYEQALQVDEINAKPGLTDALLAYGNMLQETGNKEKALAAYQQVLQYAPGNPLAQGRVERLSLSSPKRRRFWDIVSFWWKGS